MVQIGWIGLGAFGQLAVGHLSAHAEIAGYDPRAVDLDGVSRVSLADAAMRDHVVLAVPVQAIEEVAREIAPHLRPGATVYDVASVKVKPLASLDAILPPDIQLIGTHPLFGPQSAARGVAGLDIVMCPMRGSDARPVGEFLREALSLTVHHSDAHSHDRAMASVQGLTHLVAKVLAQIEPDAQPYTTRSYDLLMQAAGLVKDDSDALFRAIEQLNPYSHQVREAFFKAARDLDERLR
ncbi:prephenate dehydrogenase/arogenate dehydrogenase family protein [Maricaulis sp. D1M11]|uniref:prephenate dehydrogenase/arogenate dehydrogenase family protein n=1 Tax=Maricaulis sp. D1M11 TaxID=3076117 RepID=UPI0039B65C38